VNPAPDDLKRIESETKRSNTALSKFTTGGTPVFALQAPVAGERSDSYGSRRYFNGQPRNPHSGMDIAAAKGTLIHAPASGTVVEAGNFFFNGNTLFIDHGYGLVTMYCHLDDIKVKVGDRLAAGDLPASWSDGSSDRAALALGVALNRAMWIRRALAQRRSYASGGALAFCCKKSPTTGRKRSMSTRNESCPCSDGMRTN
jgi:murein DD-endopeptidase MepM/ murein hydrolase activator NlpD